ncbi:TlpA disulfide reductase family protein [Chelatococcus sp. SYSU_G07232]|uniref:TlpA disulfide reductase family protein n=1 Tax=Chelatococcus albus TaxID=3047466 RepID=A0ABT7AC10_9HYPH|nr:TlpA disulfide reductase family protein [Chelatococcus sp. SYSU_G07232]MDJ1156900.1 TlpA disulfide reductase family protein [Chelatococcus sp. SYSU_G07232]
MKRRDLLKGLSAVGLAAPAALSSRAVRAGERPRLAHDLQFRELHPLRTVSSLALPRLDGRTSDFARLRGKLVLVNLWATWCPQCRLELPLLRSLARQQRPNLHVLAVATDRGGKAVVARYVAKHGLGDLDVILDPDQRIAHSNTDNPNDAPFTIYAMPATYLVDPAGQIVGYVPGAVDWTSGPAEALMRRYSA